MMTMTTMPMPRRNSKICMNFSRSRSSFFVLYVYALKHLSRFPLPIVLIGCLPSDRYLGSSSWQPAAKSHFDNPVGWFRGYSTVTSKKIHLGKVLQNFRKLRSFLKKTFQIFVFSGFRDKNLGPFGPFGSPTKTVRFGSFFFCYVLAHCGYWRAVFLGFSACKVIRMICYFPQQFLELVGSGNCQISIG